ncbi:MAG: hypothetical protein JW807_08485 [Spirochaetes bacterium]|nr:hypothetical protein [Spirochaetota bacterium]
MAGGRNYIGCLILLAVLLCATCGSTVEREQEILGMYNDRNRDRYADLLVDESRYTTAGAGLHRKFYRHLIGIAGDIVEKKGMAVEKGSIGFYYDKKSGDRNKLYLGLDIDTGETYREPLESVAVSLIRGSLKEIVETLNSCRSVFGEKEVVGIVIGWMWNGRTGRERASMWIVKEDFIRYEDGMLTFSELIHRGMVTNTAGRVIRLPL